MTVCITGWNTTIAEHFRQITSEPCVRGDCVKNDGEDFPLHHDRYLFCQGMLLPKQFGEHSYDEMKLTWKVNCDSIVKACNEILLNNEHARICIIGSHSAYSGSYNSIYADSKKTIHHYIERKQIEFPDQQLVGIAPSIIEDSGMTRRREDQDNLRAREALHPKGRFLTAMEVAKMAKTLLYEQEYVSGTVVRMHGGLVV